MKRTILVIDGSKAMRFLMQTVLGQSYQVVTAADASAALFWLSKRNLPALIVVDPQLPGEEDWELVEYLHESGVYGEIPKIILSALPKAELASKCALLGLPLFVSKPFNPIDFSNLVEAAMTGEKKVNLHGLTVV